MPRKTEEEIKKLPLKDQYYAKDPMNEFKPENIFSKDSIKHINECILGKEDSENTFIESQSGFDTRSLLFMWIMAKKDKTPDDILKMDAEEVKSFVPDFEKDVTENIPLFSGEGAELSEEQKLKSAEAWGEIIGKASKMISEKVSIPSHKDIKDDKIKKNTPLEFKAFFYNSNLAICDELGYTAKMLRNGIQFRLAPNKDDKGKSIKDEKLSTALNKGFDSQFPERKGHITGVTESLNSADIVRKLLKYTNAPDESRDVKVTCKLLLELQIFPGIEGKQLCNGSQAQWKKITKEAENAYRSIFDEDFKLDLLEQKDLNAAFAFPFDELKKKKPDVAERLLSTLTTKFPKVEGFQNAKKQFEKERIEEQARLEEERLKKERELKTQQEKIRRQEYDTKLNGDFFEALDKVDLNVAKTDWWDIDRINVPLIASNGVPSVRCTEDIKTDTDEYWATKYCEQYLDKIMYAQKKLGTIGQMNYGGTEVPMRTEFYEQFSVVDPASKDGKMISVPKLAERTIQKNIEAGTLPGEAGDYSKYNNNTRHIVKETMQMILMNAIAQGQAMVFRPKLRGDMSKVPQERKVITIQCYKDEAKRERERQNWWKVAEAKEQERVEAQRKRYQREKEAYEDMVARNQALQRNIDDSRSKERMAGGAKIRTLTAMINIKPTSDDFFDRKIARVNDSPYMAIKLNEYGYADNFGESEAQFDTMFGLLNAEQSSLASQKKDFIHPDFTQDSQRFLAGIKVQDPKTGKMETAFQVACNTVMANINAGKLGDVTLESMIKKGAMKNIMKAVVMDAIQKRQAVEVPTYFEDSHGYVEDYETVKIKPMDEKEFKAYQEKEKNRMAEQAKETEKISDEEYIKDFNKEDKEAYKEAQKYASIYDQIWEDYKEYSSMMKETFRREREQKAKELAALREKREAQREAIRIEREMKELEEAQQRYIEQQYEIGKEDNKVNADVRNVVGKEQKNINNIIKQDLKNLKNADPVKEAKKDAKLPKGVKDNYGLDERRGSAKEFLEKWKKGLETTRTFAGGSSHELTHLKRMVDRTIELLDKIEDDNQKGNFSLENCRLRDEMMNKLGRAAEEYISDKRGVKHQNDENWRPFWDMGIKRFESALILSAYVKNYNKNYALDGKTEYSQKLKEIKNINFRTVERNFETMTYDPLDPKEWLEMIKDVDNIRREPKKGMKESKAKAIKENQKQDIRNIEDAVVGFLISKFALYDLEKQKGEFYNEEHARLVFDDNAKRLKGSKLFGQFMETIKGKDDFEKAMNLKKLAESKDGDKLIKEYAKLMRANKNKKKEEASAKKSEAEIKKEAPKVDAPKNDAPKNDAPDKKNNSENNKNKIRRRNSFSGHGLGGF